MIERIIDELELAKARVAHDAMKRQLEGKDASFEYGKAVGTYAGLQAALTYIDRLLKQNEEDGEEF
jgi:hypothetical protein